LDVNFIYLTLEENHLNYPLTAIITILLLLPILSTANKAGLGYSKMERPDFQTISSTYLRGKTAIIDSLPQVFMIGQNESAYESLVSDCSNPLLTVCKDSMDLAYRRWMLMLSEMEIYAEKSEFDIKGVKIWLNVFWNPNGTIKHLVYFPKPNSRNMDFDLLTIFLDQFVTGYQMEALDSQCFSHYGSAAFPTFADYYLKEK